MTLQDAIYILRRRVITVAMAVVGFTIIAIAWAFLSQPTYSTSARIFIATQSATDGQDAYAASELAKARVPSYNELIVSETLAARTVKRLRLQIAPEDLVKKVSASSKVDSVVITLSVTDSSPANAVSLANALADDFVSMVQEIETTPADSGPPAVRPLIVQHAGNPKWVSPNRPKIIAFGLFAGLLLGPVIALLRGRPGGRDEGEQGLASEKPKGTAIGSVRP